MATESTKQATIVVPEGTTAPKLTETELGTLAQFGQLTKKAETEVKGNLLTTGSKLLKPTFTFSDSASLVVDNKVEKGSVQGSVGNDSVSFGSLVKKTEIKFGAGADSVTFGNKAIVKDITVDLGKNDKSADRVVVDRLRNVDKMVVKHFGKEDTLVVNGKTFTFDQLKANNPFSDKITIKFD